MPHSPLLCAFPALHAEFVPKALRPVLHLLPCGLENKPGTTSECPVFVPAVPFPLQPRAAAHALREMLELGGRLAGRDGAGLKTLKGVPKEVSYAQNDEREALGTFSKTGLVPPPAQAQAQEEHYLIDCQKVLLLAHHLEATHLDMQAAAQKLADTDTALASLLAQDIEEAEEISNASRQSENAWIGAQLQEGSPSLSAWQRILEATAPFFSAHCVLVVYDQEIENAIKERHELAPLPQDKAAALGIPPVHGVTCATCTLPLWQLAGRSTPHNAPRGLDADCTLIILSGTVRPA